MQIIVQKFGGTSVASAEVRSLVVKKIQGALSNGYCPVVVVSAMGRKGDTYATDTLIDLALSTYPNTSLRDLDIVMCCGEIISAGVMSATLQAAGIDSIVLTGGQAGIVTDDNYSNSRILKIDTSNLLKIIKNSKVPIVCGFQGITRNGDFTTLGRGGSDTTAAALGAALNAEMVEIYTDVEGIMTADPRIVSEAKILDCISYGEVCQLAHQGAKVIHPRAVEIAMQKNIPLVVKSTFSDAPGTLITNTTTESTQEPTAITDRIATGVTYLPNIAQIKIKLPEKELEIEYKVFQTLAAKNISVDLINVHPGQIMFTINNNEVNKAAEELAKAGYSYEIITGCAKISVVGGGMREVPGVMASFIEALANNNIRILQTVDSHNTISALVNENDVHLAVCALHEKFGLCH